MKYLNLINEFFSHLKCSNCHEFFDEESVQIVRQEANNIVVRISCHRCGKNLGLAILGIDKAEYKNSLKFSEDNTENNDMPVSISTDDSPITYDDVIAAHEFFNGLGNDWSKHLPKIDD